MTRFVRRLASLPASALVRLIQLYQRTLSPALPVLTLGRCGCRFSPTCSHYAVEAIRTHGALRGVALAAVRLIKCTPLHPGGFDPVPAQEDAAQDYRTAGQRDYRTKSRPTCGPVFRSPVVSGPVVSSPAACGPVVRSP